jgi:hypothetical protein
MLSFLNTAALLGLLGVGLPVLIHLFAKQKLKRVEFSSTEFLKRIQSQTMRRMKLRQLLLLILRCLAVLLLVVAFARPTLRSKQFSSRGTARSSVVVIVDRSMSMDRKELFWKARERASSVFEMLHSDDEAALIWTVPQSSDEPEFFHSRYDAEEQLGIMEVSSAGALVTKSLKQAETLLMSSRNINREIYLVSDLQATGFAPPVDSSGIHAWDGSVFVLPISGDVENVAVINGGIENKILQPGSPLRVFADIKNCGRRRVNDLLVRVHICDEVMAQNTVTIDPGEVQHVVFSVMPDQTGWLWGDIRIEDDELMPDNTFYFCRWIPDKIRVLLLGKDREDIRALKLAMMPRNTHRQIFTVGEGYFGQDWIDTMVYVDVLFFSNYPALKSLEAGRLRRFVEDGGGVVFFMGDDVDLRNMNSEFFGKDLGITLGNVLGGQNGYFSFGTVDFEHPLFEGIFEEGRENVRSPRFFRIIDLVGNLPQKIISLTDGRPFLIERSFGDGRIIVAASGLGEAWTDLSYATIFAPMVSRSAAYLSTPGVIGKQRNRVGESLSLSVGIQDVRGSYHVEDPAGEEVLLLPEIKAGKVMLNLERTEEPGIYSFYRDDILLGTEAVNIDPMESELEPVAKKEFEKRFPDARTVFVEETEDLETIVTRMRRGRELWREILLFCLVVLIIEMMVAREAKRGVPIEK